MADPFVSKLAGFLSSKRSPLAPYAGLIYSTARKAYPQNPKLLAGLVAGIAGGEQSFGAAQNPDTQDHFNLWGWGHPPSGLTSTGKFSSYPEGISAVSRGLATGYLTQGLTRPDQIYGRYVKGDPVSQARGGGYSADWTRTVSGVLASLGVGSASGAVSSAPSAALAAAPPASTPSIAAAAPARAAPDLNALFALINSNNQLIGLPPLAFSPPAPVVPAPGAPVRASGGSVPKRSAATAASAPTVPKSSGKVLLLSPQIDASAYPSGSILQDRHETQNLPGYPALDIGGKAGTPVGAPESGRIVRLSGSKPGTTDPNFNGYAVYLLGDSGRTYYIKHLDNVAVKRNQRVKRGAVIATIAAGTRGGDHVHIGKH